MDIFCAIWMSKRIYPDTIIKELKIFREKFADFCIQEGITLPVVTIEDLDPKNEDF